MGLPEIQTRFKAPPHDSFSGGDSVYLLSAIPSVSFRSNSFPICCFSSMMVQKMSIPGHGDSDSSGISTSTRLPDACITRPCHGSRHPCCFRMQQLKHWLVRTNHVYFDHSMKTNYYEYLLTYNLSYESEHYSAFVVHVMV